MASLRRLRRRDLAWRRYARRTYWSARVSRPAWMGPDSVMTRGHFRAWSRLCTEEQRHLDAAARRYDFPCCAGVDCACREPVRPIVTVDPGWLL